MTINIQRKGDHVFISYHKDEVIVTLALTMFEARNLRDFLTDMQMHEGDPTIIDSSFSFAGPAPEDLTDAIIDAQDPLKKLEGKP